MYLIYWKWKVGSAIVELCSYNWIPYEICDDSDSPNLYDSYEAIIPSPGIPGTHRIYQTGKILSELDFAYQFLPKKFDIVSVTGTDGKSTTSWIAYNILQKEFFGKKSVYISGNFDIPFSSTVLEILKKWEKKGIIVVEISSFMSYWIHSFRSTYTIFTNLKSDHLNWHSNLQEYFDAKMNLIKFTTKKSIFNYQILDFVKEKKLIIKIPQNLRVYQDIQVKKDWTDGENITISRRNKYKLSDTNFSGLHNAMNLLSIGILASEMKICSKRMKQYFREITWLPHRLEKIGEKNGIIFVEDSKSTSSQSLEAALGSYGNTKNILLIVGWSDKWDSFVHLSQKFEDRVKAIVTIWATKEQFIAMAKEENIPYLSTDSLQDGVEWLYPKWINGDVLMISPGCASFGLFKDYLDRANQFRDAIKKLP